MPVEPILWRDSRLFILDQTLLPGKQCVIPLDTVEAVFEAIQSLRVRGAPAIGITAAYGVLVGLNESSVTNVSDALTIVEMTTTLLATSRPTAVNLFWALDRMRRIAQSVVAHSAVAHGNGAQRDGAQSALIDFLGALETEARAIHNEDLRLCRAIGDAGVSLINDGAGILTHCNAGGLATSGYGTALAVMFRAHEMGRRFHVYADETRPLLQGARLTAWELHHEGIPVTVICDNMAAKLMRDQQVQLVIVGADRITMNGDVANKIGTYGLAVLAQAHDIPFYVAAPYSTFDPDIMLGSEITIEERPATEISEWNGARTVPEGVTVYNPAFDVTPASYITGFITEKGILNPPYAITIRSLLADGSLAKE